MNFVDWKIDFNTRLDASLDSKVAELEAAGLSKSMVKAELMNSIFRVLKRRGKDYQALKRLKKSRC